MSTLNKKVIINTVLSILSLPISIFIVYSLWEMNLFDFGAGISSMDFLDIFKKFSLSLFDPVLISGLFFYFYYYCYSKIKKYGVNYVSSLIKKLGIELGIAYAVLLVVALFNKLITPFASFFIPMILIYLIPITVFVLLMAFNSNLHDNVVAE